MASFTKGKGEDMSILNSVNITSNLRAPGEYKYTYCGENSTESENSFFHFATTWYTTKITADYSLVCSTYNNENTALLYINLKEKCYLLQVYKNKHELINYNLSLIEKNQIIIPLINITQEPTAVKIFLVAESFILINEIDRRIILLDFTNGNYYPLFEKEKNDKNKAVGIKEYNIIDIYDEKSIKCGKMCKYTYVFLYSKEKGSKTYKYFYFLISHTDFKPNDNLIITEFDFGEGNEFTSEPFSVKVLKITSKNKANHFGEWYYVFIFVTRNTLFEFITNYIKVSLNNILFNYKLYKKHKCLTEIIKKINEGTQSGKKINVFFHHSIDKLSSLLFFMEMGIILSFPFYGNYTPYEMIKALKPKKEILLNDGQLKTLQKKGIADATKGVNDLTQFSPEHYLFPQTLLLANDCKCVQLSLQYVILALKDTVYIYKRNEPLSLYQYCFYEEKLTNIIAFSNYGFAFLLTANKLFKIIYTDLFDKYYDEDLTSNVNIFNKKDYQYPVFELSPEELFARYAKKLQIITDDEEENSSCEVCGRKENTVKCSECGRTSYCSLEHYKYYYRQYHFFDCLLSKYFTYNNIASIQNVEQRYVTLYNGLLRTFGQLLNHIFKRIHCSKDYQQFLHHIVVMINILEKFSFSLNVEEFSFQLNTKNETNDEKIIRTLFYIESIFFYLQLIILKCTFAMKSKLYNLTDCYLKIIKSDLIPLLSRKKSQKPLVLHNMKIATTCYKNFNFFFGMKRLFNNTDEIDLSELYLVKHLFCLSLLVKFKLKINSIIDVKESFIDISMLFESHFSETKLKNIVPYCFFSISFYLVEIGKIHPTIKLLKRMVNSFNEKADNKLKALTFYNLGILQYALSDFRIGVHNLEISYKLIVDCKLSTIFLLYVLDSLSLAYLNQKSMFKAYILIKTSLNERNKIKTMENELQCIKLNVYLNYIIDLYEYTFVTRTREILKKKKEEANPDRLIKLVLGEEEREIVTSEHFVESFLKIIKFIFGLKTEMLTTLHAHNPSKQIILSKDDNHHDKNNMNVDTSMTSNSFIAGKDINADREENIDEYDEDIEIKAVFFDSLPRHDQQHLKTLKQSLFRRDIVLRDPLGAIEPFNINYHPIYSEELMDIIRMLKSNFLLKEIFYCFQNEKWRDEYYNYSPDYCLFGLAKYLKLEKIKNMILIEKSKKIEMFNPPNKEKVVETRKSVEFESEYIGLAPVKGISTTHIDYSGYVKFKKKFDEMKSNHQDLDDYFSFKEDYLLYLYTTFKESNINRDSLFENPILLLNYIYTEIPDKEGKMSEAELIAKKRQMMRMRSKSYINPDDLDSKKNSDIDFTLRPKRERLMSNFDEIDNSDKDLSSKNISQRNQKLSFVQCFIIGFTIKNIPIVIPNPSPIQIRSPTRHASRPSQQNKNNKNASERKSFGSLINNNTTDVKYQNDQLKRKKSNLRHMSATNINEIERQLKSRTELLNQMHDSYENIHHSNNQRHNAANPNDNHQTQLSNESSNKSNINIIFKNQQKANRTNREREHDESSFDNYKFSHSNSNIEDDRPNKNYSELSHNDIDTARKKLEIVEQVLLKDYLQTSLMEHYSNYNSNSKNIGTNITNSNRYNNKPKATERKANQSSSAHTQYSNTKKKTSNCTYDKLLSSTNLTTVNTELNKEHLVRILLQHKIGKGIEGVIKQDIDEYKKNNSSLNKHSFIKNCSSSFISDTSAKTKPSLISNVNPNESKYKRVPDKIEEIKASLSKDEKEDNIIIIDNANNNIPLNKAFIKSKLLNKESALESDNDNEETISRNIPVQLSKRSIILSYSDMSNKKLINKSSNTISQDVKVSDERKVNAPKLSSKPFSLVKNANRDSVCLSNNESIFNKGKSNQFANGNKNSKLGQLISKQLPIETNLNNNNLNKQSNNNPLPSYSSQRLERSEHEDLLSKYKRIQSMRSGSNSNSNRNRNFKDSVSGEQEQKAVKNRVRYNYNNNPEKYNQINNFSQNKEYRAGKDDDYDYDFFNEEEKNINEKYEEDIYEDYDNGTFSLGNCVQVSPKGSNAKVDYK